MKKFEPYEIIPHETLTPCRSRILVGAGMVVVLVLVVLLLSG